MILLDDRVGSKELMRYFLPFDVRVESTRLEFGDACWAGSGPHGDCMIGLERKRIRDLVNSIRDRRLSGHQLPGLMESYEFVYLIVEGFYRPGLHGELEEGRGGGMWRPLGPMYREIDNHLSTLELKCGVIVRRTATPTETAAVIVDLYKWWTEKSWDQHRSHHQIHSITPQSLAHGRKLSFIAPEQEIRRKYGPKAVDVWHMAAQLDGLDTKAELVAAHFRTPRKMMEATISDWLQIPGIGPVLAARYMEVFS